jgi:hypothetical protein
MVQCFNNRYISGYKPFVNNCMSICSVLENTSKLQKCKYPVNKRNNFKKMTPYIGYIRKHKRIIIVLLLLLMFTMLLLKPLETLVSPVYKKKILLQPVPILQRSSNSSKNQTNEMKIILDWTSFFGMSLEQSWKVNLWKQKTNEYL